MSPSVVLLMVSLPHCPHQYVVNVIIQGITSIGGLMTMQWLVHCVTYSVCFIYKPYKNSVNFELAYNCSKYIYLGVHHMIKRYIVGCFCCLISLNVNLFRAFLPNVTSWFVATVYWSCCILVPLKLTWKLFINTLLTCYNGHLFIIRIT